MSVIAQPVPDAPRLVATPMLAARRARTLADIHADVCRYRRQGLTCSTCFDLNARAARLEVS